MYAHDCVHILPTSYLRVIIIHNLGKYRKRKVHTGWKPKESILVFLHQNVETEFPRNDILHKETIQLQISDHWITNTLLTHRSLFHDSETLLNYIILILEIIAIYSKSH